jgi:ubiquinone biosynthesis protein
MEVQPQLVLLQKTLLYIEGLGRQLYPQLDLWQTAKPFLENWVKEQMGVKAVFTKIKDNLPFWNEKLPEIPDLVYDYLKTDKANQHQQALLMQKLLMQQTQQSKHIVFSILAAGAMITLAIVFVV